MKVQDGAPRELPKNHVDGGRVEPYELLSIKSATKSGLVRLNPVNCIHTPYEFGRFSHVEIYESMDYLAVIVTLLLVSVLSEGTLSPRTDKTPKKKDKKKEGKVKQLFWTVITYLFLKFTMNFLFGRSSYFSYCERFAIFQTNF